LTIIFVNFQKNLDTLIYTWITSYSYKKNMSSIQWWKK